MVSVAFLISISPGLLFSVSQWLPNDREEDGDNDPRTPAELDHVITIPGLCGFTTRSRCALPLANFAPKLFARPQFTSP